MHLALTLFFQIQLAGLAGNRFELERLDVEHEIEHVFLDAGYGRELVLDAFDAHFGYGGSRQIAQQDAAHGVAQRGAEALFQGLGHEAPVFFS